MRETLGSTTTRFHYRALILIGLFLFQGCASMQSTGTAYKASLSQNQIIQILNKQHRNWKGVRYKTGGTSQKGIDCSGLVYRTFKEGMNITLPRSTELQSQLGKRIRKNRLKAGDLVFFKTGSIFKSQHVGIYINNKRFLHASTSRGVIISSLENQYWEDTYWQSRRVIETKNEL